MYSTHTMQQRQQTRKTPPTKKKKWCQLSELITYTLAIYFHSYIFYGQIELLRQETYTYSKYTDWIIVAAICWWFQPTEKTKTNVLHTLKHDSIRVNSFHCHCTHDVFFLFFFFLLNIFYTFSFFLFYWFKLQTLRVIVARPHYDLCWHFYNKIVDLNNIITARN